MTKLTWPVFLNLLPITPVTALSISADSKTINGALPPFSNETLLTVEADCSSKIYKIRK